MSEHSSGKPPFTRLDFLDERAVAGASWWREELRGKTDPESRRAALRSLAVGAGVLLAGGVGLHFAFSEGEVEERADTLTLQRQMGWSFGAEGEPLIFAGVNAVPLAPTALARLAAELAPAQPRHKPLYVPTLFQAAAAEPQTPAPGATRLAAALRAYETTAMQVAFHRGRSFASLFAGAPAGRAVLIDLPGPEAVAFAAGSCERLDPVFLFDGWPHPRGVVPAHLTLSAAATYASRLVQGASMRPANAPAAFVLDRNRLSPYRDESDRFDNRYVAKTPPLAFLRAENITQLLCVVPTAADTDSDDVLHDFLLYVAAGIDVRLVAATDFRQASSTASSAPTALGEDSPLMPYGGEADTHFAFYHSYRWGTPAKAFRIPVDVSRGFAYRPTLRPTAFASADAAGAHSRPAGFSTVSMLRTSSSRTVVGVRFGRSGSFGRGGRSGG